jgi:hypothetical protein
MDIHYPKEIRDLHDNKVVNGDPRPYIRVVDEATGTTNITNSEIAYLGYEVRSRGRKNWFEI